MSTVNNEEGDEETTLLYISFLWLEAHCLILFARL